MGAVATALHYGTAALHGTPDPPTARLSPGERLRGGALQRNADLVRLGWVTEAGVAQAAADRLDGDARVDQLGGPGLSVVLAAEASHAQRSIRELEDEIDLENAW